jgi:hypothetical protein
MDFRTPVTIARETNTIGYGQKTVFLGSCFANHMGRKFEYYQLPSSTNPLGISFQPTALVRLLERAVEEKPFSEADLICNNGVWNSLEVHSSLGSLAAETTLENLNHGLQSLRDNLKQATHLVVTLGTAWIYRYLETEQLVANCHKIPQRQFSKELLSPAEVTQSLESLYELAKTLNPKLRLVLTVSPVRHRKDGMVENQRSKSHLFAGLAPVLERPDVKYFPAYELMMDELRDYRYYERDMVHPNPLAIDYIWERFKQTWITETDWKTMETVAKIRKGLAHKPFNPESAGHLAFLNKLREDVANMVNQYPHMNF